MRKHLAALLAALVALLWPRALSADATSCSLTSSSYGNSVLNPPVGEDTDFFVNSNGGIPNVMFLLDTSASMLRLPPDGAGKSWGSFENPSGAGAGNGFGCWNARGNALTFSSPCGTTTLEQSPFNSTIACVQTPNAGCTTAPPNFAEAKDSSNNYCPYMVTGNSKTQNDKAGFDPDFYPTQFNVDRVYHDVVGWPVGSINDGWASATASPWGSNKSIADFCASQSTQAKKDSCQSCMNATGYWFDGTYQTWPSPPSCASTAECRAHGFGTCIKDSTGLEWNTINNDNTAHCAIPHVWLSGNFLNFNPPKHVVARKVLKDVLQNVRRIRLGVTTLDGSTGGTLLWGLNPSCKQSTGSPSNFDNNRSSILNKFNGPSNTPTFQGGKPLAEALLDVGRYYSPDAAPWWTGYDKSAFHEKSGGNQTSVCFSCQASAVILLTDGIPTKDGLIPGNGDSFTTPMTAALSNTAGVYTGDPRYGIANISSDDCSLCNTAAEAADTSIPNGQCNGQQSSGACDDSSNPVQAFLPKVAWYFNNVDLRPNADSGSDGVALTGKQLISTYTIGFGASGNASAILDHTARMGGGLYNGGGGGQVSDVKGLRDAILKSLEDVNTRSTSFGTASVSTLQSSASQGVLVPRFEPSRAAHWNGHLFAFDLFSEFTSGTCHIPDTGPSGPANGDYDCDGKCNSVFLRDMDGAFIQESATGAFVKNSPADRAPCGTQNLCDGACGVASSTPAKPYWDAGDLLASTKADGTAKASTQYKGWQSRKIYTVVDSASSGDKKITSADAPILLDDSTTQADLLTPYLNVVGGKFCFDLADRLAGVGNPQGATIRSELGQSPRKYTTCARTLLRYVRGADVFNETNNACGTWPGTYCTRAYQLGDVFHSSPVTVYPPLPPPPVGILCDAGLHPQCLPSLWESDAPNVFSAGYTSAYHEYQSSERYKNRHRFALVGANDGLLHAFKNGSGAGDVGTGEEIWAFLPPDLLAKLPSFTGAQHQYFVDGTPMVRDVWIDGLPNGSAGTATKDRKKTAAEFHTVAVVGERRGGTHYFALDVTDASDELDAAPKVLWVYPQPSDPAQLTYGETWSDFQPAPPPIGPVRIKTGDTPCSGNAIASGTVCFEERWVAFLSGGFDPQYTRGRGVHMVDVETGEELFDFSQPAGSAASCTADSDPRCHLNFPVAATVGMMGWGNAELNISPTRPKYFDTATFGDTGGQLWVVRFFDPGEKNATSGKVTNWYGGRVLQVGRTATVPECDYCGGQPFFQLTANVRLVANGSYRVMAGTGDRFNLLDIVGGTCSPDNLRACVLKGCTVSLQAADTTAGAVFAVTDLLGTASFKSGATSCTTTSGTTTLPGSPGSSCTGITQKIDSVVITCPSTATCSGANETTTKKMSLTCGINGSTSEFCTASTANDPGQPINVAGNPDKKNWYFSVRVFDPAGDRRIFTTQAQAITYDKARLHDQSSSLTLMNDYDAAPSVSKLATADGAGWRYYFNHGSPAPWDASKGQVTIDNVKYDIFRTDERVASNSAVEMGCGFWNTMQPAIAEAAWNETATSDTPANCAVNTPCKAGKSQLAYTYSAKPTTGEPCLLQKVGDTAVVRSVQTQSLVPPNIGKLVAYVSSGQVSFGLTSIRVPGGGSNISLGEAQDFQSITEWLPVDKSLHACRHASRTGAAPTNCK